MIVSSTVVLYNPVDDVFNNVASYADFVDFLIVVDNPEIYNQALLDKLKSKFENKIFYINNHSNLGIATALNIATDKAIELGADWNLTMDQDSRFLNFDHYLDCLKKIVSNYDDIAITAANTTRNAISFLPDQPTCNFEEKEIVITSANFVNLKYFNKIGRYEDKLFIDLVDYDFCIKARVAKLKILYFKDVLVEHNLGAVFKRKNLITKKVREKREHSAQRAYYIARNYLYLASRYGKIFPKEFNFFKIINIVFIHDVTKILLYEDEKLQKMYAKCIGLFHFMIGKYGNYKI